jgi:hypothetical protein
VPNRIIREAILSSVPVATLGWPEEVFYRRLMSIVDDYGRYEALPQLVRSRCYPLQTDLVRVADITRWMAACQKAGLVVLYEVDGKQYLQLEKFGQQQRTASKCPAPLAIDSTGSQPTANAPVFVSVSVDVSDAPQASFSPPEWIPAETWAAYLAVRKTKRAGKEPHALGLIVKDLEKFRAAGHDAIAILEASIKSSWVGVFEPKAATATGRAEPTQTTPMKPAALYVAPTPLTEAEKVAAAVAAKALKDKVHGRAAA